MLADGVVAVVTHNSEADLQDCISALSAAIAADRARHWRVAVWDNASAKDPRRQLESLSDLFYRRSETNVGFGAAINSLAEQACDAETTTLVLLNPDCRIDVDALALLADVAERGRLGIARLRWSDGEEARQLLIAKRPGGEGLGLFGIDTGQSWVRYGSGALLGIPYRAFKTVGGFDERFFLYSEEVDLQYRLHLAGVSHELLSVGGVHSGSRGLRAKSAFSLSQLLFSKELMAAKWFGRRGRWFVARAAECYLILVTLVRPDTRAVTGQALRLLLRLRRRPAARALTTAGTAMARNTELPMR